MKTIAVCLSIIFLSAAECHAGLDTLIEVARSQSEIQKQYEDETRAFEKVKRGIESGAIKKGGEKSAILAGYGKPVVEVKDADGKREDWIYKPATSSFFKGIRATLIFTQEGLLDEALVGEK